MDPWSDTKAHGEQNCTDPDCELHNPDVALEETVIGHHELDYYIAGMRKMFDLLASSNQPYWEIFIGEAARLRQVQEGVEEGHSFAY